MKRFRRYPTFIFMLVSLALVVSILSCSTFTIPPVQPQSGQEPDSFVNENTANQTNSSESEIPVNIIVSAEDANLIELYAAVSPGVVTIKTFADMDGSIDTTLELGQGSGFVIDREGHIVTNQHVIEGSEEIEVDFPSGLRVWAELIGVDLDSDLAVLKVDVPADELNPLSLGDSSLVQVGQAVIAIGNPFGLDGSMTTGIISAIGRTLDSQRASPGGQPFTAGDLIQTDAAINPGNSGGPLLNTSGEVIGVSRAIATEIFSTSGSAVNSGVGFAIPINILKKVLSSLIEEGSHAYPYLGISSLSAQSWNLKVLEQIGLPADASGAYVTCVTPGGPADRAGVIGAGSCSAASLLPGGDLITALNDHPVYEFNDLLAYLITETNVGDTITIHALRDGTEVEILLTLEARP
ncbi:MAG: trypsin-like peptidase domain-containing protein [Anaerolineales bacterium]|nr:trypsin-like peptidase domain-containing protein [Anaerolineales bacterium]